MKAAVLHGVGDLRLETGPDPEPAADEVLVRIEACGVCGSDVHMWDGTNLEGTFPLIPGHEWVGEVVEVGPAVDDLGVGDRVVGECGFACHHCARCKAGYPPEYCLNAGFYGFDVAAPGALAAYQAFSARHLHRVPEGLTLEEAALVEPLSVAYHGIWEVGGGVRADDRVLVFGAGPIGILSMVTARAAGAPVIQVEPIPYRRRLAREMGAYLVIDPATEDVVKVVEEETDGEGATLILECSGSDQAIAETVDCAAGLGRILLTGHSAGRKVPVELGKAVLKGLRIIGNNGNPYMFPPTLTFLAQHLVDVTPLITHRFALDDIQEAFDLCAQRDCGKVLIERF